MIIGLPRDEKERELLMTQWSCTNVEPQKNVYFKFPFSKDTSPWVHVLFLRVNPGSVE